MKSPVYINAFGINCALGNNAADVAARLFVGDTSGMVEQPGWIPQQTAIVGAVTAALPSISAAFARFASRNNQVLLQAANQIEAQVQQAIARFGAHRIGVVLGTSTTGIAETEHYLVDASQAERYCYQLQEQGSPAQFLAAYWQLGGPAWVVSTACSSSARAMIAAKRLLDQGICDAVISGGTDTLCRLTLNGFTALEAVSATRCDPFSARRNGINIGEGAGVFLLSKTPDLSGESFARGSTSEKSGAQKSVARFCGGGISMDAHHMSAPDPEGRGAVRAMQAALTEAGIAATDIGYVNLHGTATRQNDAMESHAMAQVFPAGVACSSTKPLTGHALGAASAIEAALCLLALSGTNDKGTLPPHIWSSEIDASLPPLAFTQVGQPVSASKNRYMMSNSFAFGGNNVSLIFGHPL